jgi:hypothetical protein
LFPLKYESSNGIPLEKYIFEIMVLPLTMSLSVFK